MPASSLNRHIYIYPHEISANTAPLDILRSLADYLAEEEGVDADEVFKAAQKRENEEHTAIGRGLAIPHARLAHVSYTCLIVAKCVGDVNWYGKPVRLIVLSVVQENNPDAYLQIMGALMRWRIQISQTSEKEWPLWPIPILHQSILKSLL